MFGISMDEYTRIRLSLKFLLTMSTLTLEDSTTTG